MHKQLLRNSNSNPASIRPFQRRATTSRTKPVHRAPCASNVSSKKRQNVRKKSKKTNLIHQEM